MSATAIKTNYPALYTLVIVFFFWGFIAAGNTIFIPFCKHYFSLDQFQSQLIEFAFYTAYYIGALGLFAYSSFTRNDLIGNWGYKRSIVYGLLFSALGAVAMIIAVLADVYIGMLTGLFIVALGFSLQQTAANPFAILLGDPKTGSSRINLCGGINSFGTTIGPIILGLALFGGVTRITDEQIAGLDLSKVVLLYTGVGLLFIIAAGIFYFSKKVPEGLQEEKVEKANKALKMLLVMTGLLFFMFIPVFNSYKSSDAIQVQEYEMQIAEQNALLETTTNSEKRESISYTIAELEYSKEEIFYPLEKRRMYWLLGALLVVVASLLYAQKSSQKKAEGWGAMQYPQTVLGMLALFMYVGVEVTIGSNLGELLSIPAFGYTSSEISPFLSMYWGSLMIGRWAGAVYAFNLKSSTKTIALIAAPVAAFLLVIGINELLGFSMQVLYFYIICVAIQILAMLWTKGRPAFSLLLFATLGVIAMIIGLFTEGNIAIYAFLSGGLFCSIMWPSIFSLSLIGLGKYTSQGSAFLVMMILGGGVIPPIQGKLADIIGIHQSYIIPVIGFAYIALFAVIVRNILLRQNIDVDSIEQ